MRIHSSHFPHRPRRRWIARGGFTLIELLLSLVIGTMILGATAGIYVTTLDSWQRGSEAYVEVQTADKISALIERHLRAAVSPTIDNQAVFYGEDLTEDPLQPGHRLTLCSAAPGRFPRNLPPTDVCEICIEYDPAAAADGMSLRIQCPSDDQPEEGGYLVKLSTMVCGFKVLYFDGDDWVETWNEDRLPQAVEYTILLNPKAKAGAQDESAMGEPAPAEGIAGQTPLEIKRLVWLPISQTDETVAAEEDEDDSATGPAGGGGPNGDGDGMAGGGAGRSGGRRGRQ